MDEEYSSKEKLEEMHRLQTQRRRFKRIAIPSLIVDTLMFFSFEILKYQYFLHFLYPTYDLIILITKLSIQAILSILLLILLIKSKRIALLFFMIVYIVIGTIYALILIISNIQTPNGYMPITIKSTYYSDHIYILVICLSSVSWISKFISSICMGMFYYFNENFEGEFEINSAENMIYQRESYKKTFNKQQTAKTPNGMKSSILKKSDVINSSGASSFGAHYYSDEYNSTEVQDSILCRNLSFTSVAKEKSRDEIIIQT